MRPMEAIKVDCRVTLIELELMHRFHEISWRQHLKGTELPGACPVSAEQKDVVKLTIDHRGNLMQRRAMSNYTDVLPV